VRRSALLLALVLLLLLPGRQARLQEQLLPTAHPAVSERVSDLWLVPDARDPEAQAAAQYKPLLEGAIRYREGDYAAALPLVSRPSLAGTPLADYATYYQGLALLRLSQGAEARRTLDALIERRPVGHLALAAPLAAAEAAEVTGDHAAAIRIYERLAADKLALSDDVLSRLGRAALAAGDRKKAAEAFLRVYYDFPLTDAATTAASHLSTLGDTVGRPGHKRDLGRAQQLFGARRYAEAYDAFKELQPRVGGDERELVDLRVAESDFYLKRYAAARDALRPYLDRASRKAEARFFYLSALRELGDHEQFITLSRALIDEFPGSSWAEETLNNLARHYVLENDDARAAALYAELFEKFPKGPHAERAAWKAGWWQYKLGNYAETARIFESAAANFPRSDYRPPYLYWSARAYEKLGQPEQARARLRLVFTDYANSYYGRLAEKSLGRAGADDIVAVSHPPPPARQRLPNEERIRHLLASGLYDDALNELRYAQRASGTSPVIDATMAWAYHQKGELRRAITFMRRAYPQFLTAAQKLPPQILQVIFPLTYWDAIRRYSAARGLDPYLISALVAQESTFDPEAKSIANAYGMMQIVPATGRRLARTLGIRRFDTSMLLNAETNIRLGTLYFSQLVRQFGGAHYALASYNAGENRVVRWKAERPGIDQEEWIDDIPFPETQNYVKRILGTAEDYRRLYGEGVIRPQPVIAADGNPAAVLPKRDEKPAVKKSPAVKKPPAGKKPPKRPTSKTPVKRAPAKKATSKTAVRK
jgi:soluble lytic murein transglycosylase